MNTTITKEELAAQLNGREYGEEITKYEEQLAKQSGLLVVFGYSDDNIEFRGVFNDESGCGESSTIRFDSKGIIPDWESVRDEIEEGEAQEYFARKLNLKEIETEWDAEGYSWLYHTREPHAAFDIMEGDQKYCRGIVISMEQSK